MPEPILPRESVAKQAEEMARWWVANPNAPRPLNPHLYGTEAAAAWAADFQRQLLRLSAEGEADEGSA